MNNNSDFSKAKVGDKCWSIQLGECEIKHIYGDSVVVSAPDASLEHWIDGRRGLNDYFPSLFHSNPNIVIPPPPKRMVKKRAKYWVNIYSDEAVCGHLSQEDADTSAGVGRLGPAEHIVREYEVEE